MKTTIELPDPLFRRAKATAAERGQSLKQLVTEALQEKLASGDVPPADAPAWSASFGALGELSRETARVQSRIDDEFGRVQPEDRT